MLQRPFNFEKGTENYITMTVQPRLASTVMLLRDHPTSLPTIEVFMVRRVVQSEFMPDIYVFPGGSASQDDCVVETTDNLCATVTPTAADPEGRTGLGTGARAAAIRELFEEANVLLAYHDTQLLSITPATEAHFTTYRAAFNQRQGSLVKLCQHENLVLATDRLAYFAHWITPPEMPKRYDTHFFLAVAPTEQEALYDQLETSEGLWITPTQALERFAAGTFPLAFPTYHQLRDLAAYANTQEALAATSTRYVTTHEPIVTYLNDVLHVYLPDQPDHLWKV